MFSASWMNGRGGISGQVKTKSAKRLSLARCTYFLGLPIGFGLGFGLPFMRCVLTVN
jgi:hypothetical protein